MKLLELLQVSTDYLAKRNVDSPRLTVELMLAELLGKTRMQVYLEFEREMKPEELDRLRPWVKQRGEGVPLQHLIGHTMFDGRKFKVTADVLIPRPETEFLLEEAVKRVKSGEGALVDVGTGSGILGVSLAHRFPEIEVFAIDVSPAALVIARENVGELKNLTFIEGNLLDLPANSLPEKVQGIVANLPYIPTRVISGLSREVQHDPRLALDGGADGLDLVRRLIQQASGRTKWIGLEIFEGQADLVDEELRKAGFKQVMRVKDLRGVDRVVFGEVET